MAYLGDIERERCRCGRLARVRLYSKHGHPMDSFCRRCGRQAERDQQEREETAERISEATLPKDGTP